MSPCHRILIFGIVLAAVSGFFWAQQPPAKPAPGQPAAMTVQNLKDGLYLVKAGSGANAGFFVGTQGVVVIDAKMTADAARQMLEEIRKVTPLPVQTVLLTHSDGDHVNGLAGFPAGLDIVSSEGTRKEMEEAFRDEKFAALRAYLPTQVFSDRGTLRLGDTMIELLPFGPAHTSGDTVVFFPSQKIAFIGDLAFIGRDPLIHRQKGGTFFGYTGALRKMLDLDADVYIGGHNDPLGKDDLRGLLASMEEKLAKVKALVAEGKTLDEVKKAFGIEDAVGAGGRRWPSLVEVIYLELTEKKDSP